MTACTSGQLQRRLMRFSCFPKLNNEHRVRVVGVGAHFLHEAACAVKRVVTLSQVGEQLIALAGYGTDRAKVCDRHGANTTPLQTTLPCSLPFTSAALCHASSCSVVFPWQRPMSTVGSHLPAVIHDYEDPIRSFRPRDRRYPLLRARHDQPSLKCNQLQALQQYMHV